MKSILITGSSGFVGRNLVRSLLGSSEFQVITVDRHPGHNPIHYVGDLRRAKTLNQITENVDATIHLAADVDIGGIMSSFLDNVIASIQTALWLRAKAVRKVVYLSTAAVYRIVRDGQPIDEESVILPKSPYAISKYLGELIFRALVPHTIVIRSSYIFGPGDTKSNFALMVERLIGGGPLVVRDENRDYVFITDVVSALTKSLRYSGQRKLFNLGSGKVTSLREVSDLICNLVGRPAVTVVVPGRRNAKLSLDAISRELGWMPQVEIQQGTLLTVKDRLGGEKSTAA